MGTPLSPQLSKERQCDFLHDLDGHRSQQSSREPKLQLMARWSQRDKEWPTLWRLQGQGQTKGFLQSQQEIAFLVFLCAAVSLSQLLNARGLNPPRLLQDSRNSARRSPTPDSPGSNAPLSLLQPGDHSHWPQTLCEITPCLCHCIFSIFLSFQKLASRSTSEHGGAPPSSSSPGPQGQDNSERREQGTLAETQAQCILTAGHRDCGTRVSASSAPRVIPSCWLKRCPKRRATTSTLPHSEPKASPALPCVTAGQGQPCTRAPSTPGHASTHTQALGRGVWSKQVEGRGREVWAKILASSTCRPSSPPFRLHAELPTALLGWETWTLELAHCHPQQMWFDPQVQRRALWGTRAPRRLPAYGEVRKWLSWAPHSPPCLFPLTIMAPTSHFRHP